MSSTLETTEDTVHREMEAIFGSPHGAWHVQSSTASRFPHQKSSSTSLVRPERKSRRYRTIAFAIILLSAISLVALGWYRTVQTGVSEARRTSAQYSRSSNEPTDAVADRSGEATVRAFYAALNRGSGAEASAQVVPEKRSSPAFSADAMSRFYGALPQPLRLTRIVPVSSSSFRVSYRFAAGKTPCNGEAVVAIAHREGRSFIQSIRALNGC